MAEYRNEKPYIIITSGTVGAGKTTLIKESLRHLEIEGQPYTKILIDDIVENNDEYKRRVMKIIKEVSFLCKLIKNRDCTQSELDKFYNDPEENVVGIYEAFSDAYFGVRNAKGCNGNVELNCNELNDKNLAEAVLRRDNIIFEFTGQYIPNWLMDTRTLSVDYNIVFSYSLVNIVNLRLRNTRRASDAVHKFIENYDNPAPRLPRVGLSDLRHNVKQLRNVLIDLYRNCFLHHKSDEKCGNLMIHRMLIFDNNGKVMRLIFDSDVNGPDVFLDVINVDGPMGQIDSPRRKTISKVDKLKNLTVIQLKEKVKKSGYKGYSKLNKSELIKLCK
jgi:hypothetical protein